MTAAGLLAIGVDGAPGGWVAAAAVGDRTELRFFRDIASLAEWRDHHADGGDIPVAIDIPIGLPRETEYRGCDTEARNDLVGTRKSSVFMPPGRYLLAAAAAGNEKIPTAQEVFGRVQELVARRRLHNPGARGFSRQAAGILLKIAEVDAFARTRSRAHDSCDRWLLEVHPELCFQAMYELSPGAQEAMAVAPKASALGQLQRVDLITAAFPDADERVRTWPDASRYSLLDICDAYAALWTALRWREHVAGTAREAFAPPIRVLGESAVGVSPRDPTTGAPMRMVI